MAEARARIGSHRGLHTRPAALAAAYAASLGAPVRLARAGEGAPEWCDAASTMELLLLDLARGDEVRLRCDAPGGERIVARMADFLSRDHDAA
ncbi:MULTISPECIES: HPr family phosphocarrier protein [unclassified Microbacterium]|uniref:HPr family phosphocarrier protein n=1 Tax=unclassified Microbacterium TaxID=2609290 RepID=UPI003018D1B9